MKLFAIIISTILSSTSLVAQTWQQVCADSDYIVGHGYGSTVSEADKNALADMLSMIQVTVSSSTTVRHERVEINGKRTQVDEVYDNVTSSTEATLTNTGREIISPDPDAHVVRWISKSEVAHFYDGIERKVKEYVDAAYRAEQSGKIDLALRDYYWALSLLKSHQNPNDISATSNYDGKQYHLLPWIIEQMNDIFGSIKISVVERRNNDVDLFFTYKGRPVNSLDYTYFDGRAWSNIYSAKDGRGVLELASGFDTKSYKLKFEYEFRGEATIDRDLACIMNVVEPPTMKNAFFDVQNNITQSQTSSVETSFTQTDAEDIVMPTEVQHAQSYRDILNQVISFIQTKNPNPQESLFAKEALDIYKRLIVYGNARIIGTPEFVFLKHGNYVVGRGLKMSFSFKNGVRKSFVEDVVFTFDSDNKICNIAFGLGATAEGDILCKGAWNETSRMAIMQFLENYKTAFALKRLDYIESIFDDDAIIITGTVVKKATASRDDYGNFNIGNNPNVRYSSFDKKSYIKHLARSFASKEYINLRFADNEVYQMGKGGESFAIQLSQEYYSSNYGDKGYLFLLVDVNDPLQPIIKVRTWQPEKDTHFKDRIQAGMLR